MRLAAAAVLLLAGCGTTPANEAQPEGSASVVIQSEDAIDGRRPELTLICGANGNSFSLALVRPFEGDATGATGIVKVDDGVASRLGLVWLGEDRWAPDLDAAAESAIVRTMLAGRSIYFSGPEQVTERVYRWDLTRIGSGIADVRTRCG